MLIKAGVDMADQVDIKRRGGRWDPDKITEKTLVNKDLGRMMAKEVEELLNKGVPDKKAAQLGIDAGIKKWREKYADKSGG